MSLARVTLFVLLCSALSAPVAQAQGYPNKPINVILPGAPGVPMDIAAREIGALLRPVFNQPMVVDNRIGANGIIGLDACAKAAPDGYTICSTTSPPVTVSPYIYAKLPYDPQRDLLPIIEIGIIYTMIAVPATSPVNSFHELIDLAKAKPRALNWGSWGSGSPSHLYLAWVESNTGALFTHVPYKTPDQAVAALVTGDVQAIANSPGALASQAKAGKLKLLATSGSKRSPFFPEAPTLKELGLNFQFRSWAGIFAPAGTPRDIVMRLNTEINKLIADPSFVAKVLTPFGMEPTGGTPDEFAASLKVDFEVSAALVKATGMKPE
jgi:tripartite-type tricarboxylate transporter receptor subunit TctC